MKATLLFVLTVCMLLTGCATTPLRESVPRRFKKFTSELNGLKKRTTAQCRSAHIAEAEKQYLLANLEYTKKRYGAADFILNYADEHIAKARGELRRCKQGVPPAPMAAQDDDHDGVPNTQDRCPTQAEDKDGFNDHDGCPDPDNDGDGIADKLDKCPNEPETYNKINDEDGCADNIYASLTLSDNKKAPKASTSIKAPPKVVKKSLSPKLKALQTGVQPKRLVIRAGKLAVMPLAPIRVPKDIAKLLSEILTYETDKLQGLQVISAQDISMALGMEKMKEALGCSDVSCASEIGGALGVRYMLSGTVGRLGSKISLTFMLFDTEKMQVVTRSRHSFKNDEDLYEAAIIKTLHQLLYEK